MEGMAWTDERLDDFAGRVSADIRDLRSEISDLRGEMHAEFRAMRTEMREESRTMTAQIDALRLMVMRFGGGLLIAQFGMIAALIARG